MKRRGMVLTEVMVIIVIMLILLMVSFKLAFNILQKAKVVSAKAQIAQFALLLEAVKDDTGLYPVFLSDLLARDPPLLHQKGWAGPYTVQIPLDPWGYPYFYMVPPTTLFSSPPLPREYGKPETAIFNIATVAGQGKLRIENYGVTSCSIYLNGVEVVREQEFRNSPRPQIIEKNVTLLENNVLEVRARSTPGDVLYGAISGFVPTKEYFILGSYGRNGRPGGSGFQKDIVWYSYLYPNFQR